MRHCTYECRKPHFYYRANVAYDTYRALLKDTREGIGLTREELRELDCLITPLLRQGQSISHIFAVYKDEIPCSMKTVYNYIDQGIFTVRNLDLPKKVKYKERKKKRQEAPTDYAYREKRTCQAFLKMSLKQIIISTGVSQCFRFCSFPSFSLFSFIFVHQKKSSVSYLV